MTALAKTPHLQRRGAVYYFRRRVPIELQATFGFKEWTTSLETTNHDEAKRRVRAKSHEIDRTIEAARDVRKNAPPPLSREDAQRIAAVWTAEQIAADEAARLSEGTAYFTLKRRYVAENQEAFLTAYARGRVNETMALAHALLRQQGATYPVGDPSVRLVAGELLPARIEALGAIESRNNGLVVRTPTIAFQERAPQALAGERTVGDLVTAYSVFKGISRPSASAWAEASQTDRDSSLSAAKRYEYIFVVLRDFIGSDRPLNALTRERCREVKSLLELLPKHANKRGLGQLGQELGKTQGAAVERLAPKTVAAYMNNLSAMLNWAVQEGWMPSNPAKGLGQGAANKVKRSGFSRDQLDLLFASLQPFKESQPWKFWVPALALYTGARENEVCQLERSDIVTIDNRPCMRVSPFNTAGERVPWKSVKTKSSERVVPLHQSLISAGFLSFVDAQPADAERLFSDLKLGPNGGFSHGLSKWFARHLSKIGLNEPGLVFYSFRHGFANACRRGGVEEATRKALGGWANSSIADGYGNGAAIEFLAPAIERLDLEGFELSSKSECGGNITT